MTAIPTWEVTVPTIFISIGRDNIMNTINDSKGMHRNTNASNASLTICIPTPKAAAVDNTTYTQSSHTLIIHEHHYPTHTHRIHMIHSYT